jgi:hypothetical protein
MGATLTAAMICSAALAAVGVLLVAASFFQAIRRGAALDADVRALAFGIKIRLRPRTHELVPSSTQSSDARHN